MDLLGEYSGFSYIVPVSLVLLLLVFGTDGSDADKKKCTQIVKEQRVQYLYKRISVTRKIPADCSQWDRDWVWLTGKDCSPKYRVVYMNDRKRLTFTTYRTEHVCCPDQNGTLCQNGVEKGRTNGTSSNSSHGELLKIILPVIGCLAFVLLIAIIIISIVMYRKRRKNRLNNAQGKTHAYECVKGQNSNGKKKKPSKDKKGAPSLNKKELPMIPYSVQVIDDDLVGNNDTSGHYEPIDQFQISKAETLIKDSDDIVNNSDIIPDLEQNVVDDNVISPGDIMSSDVMMTHGPITEPSAPPYEAVSVRT